LNEGSARFSRLLPIAILLTLGMIWGSVTNVARYVATHGIPPVSYAFWTLAIGATALLVLNVVRRAHFPLSTRHLAYYASAGLLSSGLPTANMFICLNHISVGLMSLVLTMVPLITYVLALATGLERPALRRGLGIALGLTGALLVILPDQGIPAGTDPGWFLMAFLTPLGYASGTVITARFRPDDVDALVGANGMMYASSLFLLFAALLVEDFYPLWSTHVPIDLAIVAHGLLSAVAFSLFFVLVRIAGPVYFSQVAYLVTFFGIAIAMTVFDERYGGWLWLALGVTVCGVWLVNSAQRSSAKRSSSP